MDLLFKRPLLAVAIAATALTFSACGPKAETPGTADSTGASAEMSTSVDAANEKMMRAFVDEVLLKGDTSVVANYLAADYVEHTPSPGQTPGIDGFRKMIAEWHGMMPDMKIEITDMFTHGDRVFMMTRQTGTNTGSAPGMPATNKAVDVNGVDIVRIKDGKATEHWGYYEEMKMMQQLGLMPPMDGAAATGAPKADAPKKGADSTHVDTAVVH